MSNIIVKSTLEEEEVDNSKAVIAEIREENIPKLIFPVLCIFFTEYDHPNVSSLLLMSDIIVKSILEDEEVDNSKAVIAEIHEKKIPKLIFPVSFYLFFLQNMITPNVSCLLLMSDIIVKATLEDEEVDNSKVVISEIREENIPKLIFPVLCISLQNMITPMSQVCF